MMKQLLNTRQLLNTSKMRLNPILNAHSKLPYSFNFCYNSMKFLHSFRANYSTLSKNMLSNSNRLESRLNYNSLIRNSIYKVQRFGVKSRITKRNDKMKTIGTYKRRDRQSLRKRVIIVGPSFNRHFLFRKPGIHHKRRRKTSRNLSRPRMKLMSMANLKFCKRNLPHFKTRRCKYGRKF
jgi:hypothetical protein